MADERKLKLSPPWISYYRMVKALFGNDPQVDVRELTEGENGQHNYIMVVNDEKKASAIKTILKDMSEIWLNAYIYGPNENSVETLSSLDLDVYQTAFNENPIFEKTISVPHMLGKTDYCVFKKEVIQFWNDDISDYLGNYTTLAKDIAREILNADGVQFCIAGD